MPEEEPFSPNGNPCFRPVEEAKADLAFLVDYTDSADIILFHSERQTITSLLFLKIKCDIQAARILMEHSLLPQTGVILRSALESLIYQSSCAANDDALRMFPKVNDREILKTLGEEGIKKLFGFNSSEAKHILGIDDATKGANIDFFLSRSSLPRNFYAVYRYLSMPVHGLLFHLKDKYRSIDNSGSTHPSNEELDMYLAAANIIFVNAISIYCGQFNKPIPENVGLIIEKYIH